MSGTQQTEEAMRLDRLLVYLRFCRTRSRAAALIDQGHTRLNGERITRTSACVYPGNVLTIPIGNAIRIVQILSLPERRGPPGFARSHYRELDRDGETGIAADQPSA